MTKQTKKVTTIVSKLYKGEKKTQLKNEDKKGKGRERRSQDSILTESPGYFSLTEKQQ